MLLASISLAGFLLPAAPQQSPDAAPLDPVLTSAIDRLQQASGHSFDAEGIELLPFEPDAPLACARVPANQLADVVASAITTDIRARSETGKPLLLATGALQAFRDDDGKVVFRRRLPGARDDGDRKWGPWTDLDDVADADLRERIELRLLRLVERLPTPEELLARLGARATSCVAIADPKREGRTTFECQIPPDAGWKLGATPRPAPACLSRCTLRIVVERGAILELEIESDAAPEATVSVRYRIHDVGATKVIVPAEVARRLGGR